MPLPSACRGQAGSQQRQHCAAACWQVTHTHNLRQAAHLQVDDSAVWAGDGGPHSQRDARADGTACTQSNRTGGAGVAMLN